MKKFLQTICTIFTAMALALILAFTNFMSNGYITLTKYLTLSLLCLAIILVSIIINRLLDK